MQNLKKPLSAPARRNVLASGAAAATVMVGAGFANPTAARTMQAKRQASASAGNGGSYITTKDNAQLDYKDWGTGQTVVFCHG